MTSFAYRSKVEHLYSLREIVRIGDRFAEPPLFSFEDEKNLKRIREKLITQKVMSIGKSRRSGKNIKNHLGKTYFSNNSSRVELKRLKTNKKLQNRRFPERTLAQAIKLFGKPLLFLADSRWRILRRLAALLSK